MPRSPSSKTFTASALASLAALSLATACSSSSGTTTGSESSGTTHGSGSSSTQASGSPHDAGGAGVTFDAAAFAASMSCYHMSDDGCTVTTSSIPECDPDFTQGLCPSAGLIGCCVTTVPSGQFGIGGAVCIYSDQESPNESDCTEAGGAWSTQPL